MATSEKMCQVASAAWHISEIFHPATLKERIRRGVRFSRAGRCMAASQGGLPGGTVLVVEDDFLIAELICALLESTGYAARHAGDGAEALALVEAGGIELVLLDLMLPGINGFEVCRRVRARPEPVYLPIIMLTALQSPTDRATGFAAGADDYLSKPFDADALLERVAVWVRTRRCLQAAEGARERLQSGDTDDDVVHHGLLEEGIARLQKPSYRGRAGGSRSRGPRRDRPGR
jgi:CheY-like chemotaxis protein